MDVDWSILFDRSPDLATAWQQELENAQVADYATTDVWPQNFDATHAAIKVARGQASSERFVYRKPIPKLPFPWARTALVVAYPYQRIRYGSPGLKVASYARVDNYRSLKILLDKLVEIARDFGLRSAALMDSNQAYDKGMARRARLGYVGRNTLVMVRKYGAAVVLGTVFVSSQVELRRYETPMRDPCVRCRRCIDACPSGALRMPGLLDVDRCIGWLTQKPDITTAEARSLNGWIYGCDDCMLACPVGAAREIAVQPYDKTDFLVDTDDQLLSRYGHWYLSNRDPVQIRRNALIGVTLHDGQVSMAPLIKYFALCDQRLKAQLVRLVLEKAKPRVTSVLYQVGWRQLDAGGSKLGESHRVFARRWVCSTRFRCRARTGAPPRLSC
jgi:epoxyqueuosine reductase